MPCRDLARYVAFLAVFGGVPFSAHVAADEPQRVPTFEQSVWPILAVNCVACHGAAQPKAGLDLRTVSAILRGGESGAAIVRNDADASLIIERIVAGEMPPAGKGKLTGKDVAVLRAWVEAGAPAERPDVVPTAPPLLNDAEQLFWAFRPLAHCRPPAPADPAEMANEIDAFLLTKLAEKGLRFSPRADRVTLVRRLSLDLLGLPPSPEEVDSFLADQAPDAYERLVDRLVASPHFGERWGRHWLDVAGYADTVGFDIDANQIIVSEGKWLYRDYVVHALNEDKPFDRFLVEQLAGDELYDWKRAEHLSPEMREALIATGFLRTARDLTHEDVGVIPQNFHNILHDTLEIVGTGLLALTVNCARCHDHKFDPITQEDYYRLTALFTPAYNPAAWRPVMPFAANIQDRSLPNISPAEVADGERRNHEIDHRVEGWKGELVDLRRPYQARLFENKLSMLPEPIRADTKAALETAAEKRNEVQKYLAEKLAGTVAVKPAEIAATLSESDRAAVMRLEAKIAEEMSHRAAWGKIQALWDVGPPPATHLLVRGNYETPGPEAVPGFLRVLCRSESEAKITAVPPHEGTSGRRSELARRLVSAESPASALVARVMVNRVWAHLFGRGIVPTADNFGQQGERPTNPELLDWLSAQFVAEGWRIKPLIRRMVTSAAYRQASHGPAERVVSTTDANHVDPGNQLLGRMRLRRLESEVVRDAVLAASGKLNRAVGGPPVLTRARPDGLVVVDKERLAEKADAWRRSIYLLARRAYNLSLLTVFDQPLVATNCLCRDVSAVPSQSLTMLNDEFVLEQSGYFAERVAAGATSPPAQIDLAFRLTLGRRPTPEEAAWCEESMAQQTGLFHASGLDDDQAARQALIQFCRTLFNTSEFLYVE
ncbi:MAG TPA: PSD1 and planctomycete cytochrome C domain-containing protein [Pirellulales bacterium]|nr:PSD1 and planctomycete cytochrome C domain-containing protein [Pirellulales bacterium]